MEEYILIYSIVTLAVAAGLGFIPASIAKNKGYSFGLWWFYGWMLFIVAIIHVSVIPDKNAQQIPINQMVSSIPYCPPYEVGQSAADELKKYKELLDQGVINPDEFKSKKEQLLKMM